MSKQTKNIITDCGRNYGCGTCMVCKYQDFLEWAQGCAPAGSTIERNEMLDIYLVQRDSEVKPGDTVCYAHMALAQRYHEEALRKVLSVEVGTFGDTMLEVEGIAGLTNRDLFLKIDLAKGKSQTVHYQVTS